MLVGLDAAPSADAVVQHGSMSEADLRALYAYIYSLAPAGGPAPDALPLGEKPKTPTIDAVPHPPG